MVVMARTWWFREEHVDEEQHAERRLEIRRHQLFHPRAQHLYHHVAIFEASAMDLAQRRHASGSGRVRRTSPAPAGRHSRSMTPSTSWSEIGGTRSVSAPISEVGLGRISARDANAWASLMKVGPSSASVIVEALRADDALDGHATRPTDQQKRFRSRRNAMTKGKSRVKTTSARTSAGQLERRSALAPAGVMSTQLSAPARRR